MDKSLYLDHLNLLPIPGEAFFYPEFFDKNESDRYFAVLPRYTAFYGDEDISYNHNGILMNAQPWIPELQTIKEYIESKFEVEFNSCTLNHYGTGADHIGWHRDNKKNLGQYPFIASVSFGANRIFQFRHYVEKIPIISVELSHGSLLVMKAETQHLWEHRLPKTIIPTGPRINLTFRFIHK